MNKLTNKLSVIFIVLFLLFVKTPGANSAATKGLAGSTGCVKKKLLHRFDNSSGAVDYMKNIASTDDSGEEFVLFIVDFSNSMSEKLHGTSKINMVLDTMQEILPKLPENKRVGLRVYGHKGGFLLPDAACKASSLIVPMTKNSAASIQSALFNLKPTGWTPITYSLKQAVNNDFAGVKGKKRIILLSDGGENCDESPCDYVMELTKTRQDIVIDVIAFNIYDTEANNQLKCTALVTSGKFYSANTAAQLLQSLQKSLNVQKEVQGVIITH